MEKNHHNIDEIFAKSLGDHSIEPPDYVWDKIKVKLDSASMENDQHNIDEIFSKSLSEHSIDPPAYVWENVKAKLDVASKNKRSKIIWFFGTASAILISFIGGYFIANTSTDKLLAKTSNKKMTNYQLKITDAVLANNSKLLTQSNKNENVVSENGSKNTIGKDKVNTNGFLATNSKYVFKENKITTNNNNNSLNTQSTHKLNVENNNDKNSNQNTNELIAILNQPIEEKNNNVSSINVEVVNNETVNDNNSEVVNNIDTIAKSNLPVNNSNHNEKVNPKIIIEEPITTFTVLPYFSPTYTFRNSLMDDMSGIQNAFGSDPQFSEKVNFSFSTGVLIGYNFTPRVTIFIGASFNTFSNTTNRNYAHSKAFDQMPPGDSATAIITSAGELNGVNLVPTKTGLPEDPTYIVQDYQIGNKNIGSVKSITQTFSYIEVPVLARYRVFGPKLGLIITGGMSTGFIVQNDVILETDNETKTFGQTKLIRNFNMNAIIGIGIEARILPFMYLNIEPTFKYSFLNWSNDSRIKMNPISIGLNTGLSFKF